MHVPRTTGKEAAPLPHEVRFATVLLAIRPCATAILQLRTHLNGNLVALAVNLTLLFVIRGKLKAVDGVAVLLLLRLGYYARRILRR